MVCICMCEWGRESRHPFLLKKKTNLVYVVFLFSYTHHNDHAYCRPKSAFPPGGNADLDLYYITVLSLEFSERNELFFNFCDLTTAFLSKRGSLAKEGLCSLSCNFFFSVRLEPQGGEPTS